MSMIPYGKQDISENDISAVFEVLQSDFLTQGPAVPAFESSVAEYCGADYAVAVNSATSALHIACLSLGLGKGDVLWTSPNTFVASANCALYCGATVDFVDIDSQTYNMSVDALRDKLELAEESGSLPKIVIPVHFAGQSCDMREIKTLSNQYGFKIIEDAAHAIGGKYLDKAIGGCQYSDITVFSFHPVKIITTAEGGLATTNDQNIARKLALYRSHGISSDIEDMDDRPEEEIWNYQQIDLGFNYRMTELQAALGISQIKRLDQFVAKRHALAVRYDELLVRLPITLPFQNCLTYSSYHLYPILIDLEQVEKGQKQIYNELIANGIGVNVHYIPVHRQPYYEKMGFSKGDFPESEIYHQRVLSIPVYFGMTFEQQDKVVEVLKIALVKKEGV